MTQIPVENEQIPDDGMVVPKEVIRPFGRALNQLFKGSVSRMANQGTFLQRLFPGEEFAKDIEHNIEQLTQILTSLESSSEVRLVSNGGSNFTFRFSEDREPDVVIPPGEVTIDPDLSKKLVDACSDTLINQLNGIYGFSQILEDMTESKEAKEIAGGIHRASQEFLDVYRQNFTEPGEFQITTNDAGNSSIASLKRKN